MESWSTTRTFVTMAAAGVVLASILTARFGSGRLAWLFGPVPDPIGVALVTGVGWYALQSIIRRGWIGDRPGYLLAVVAATALAVVVVAVDLTIPFSEDTNRPWPESILYYPTVAVVAEVAFRIVPLAVLLALTGWRFDPGGGFERRVMTALVAVALIEVVFQVLASVGGGDDQRLLPFVAVHLAVFGIVELGLLRHSGLSVMLTFRLTYYLWWHIVWGHFRLSMLF